MAVHSDPKKLTIDSIKENLLAINFSIDFNKANNPSWSKEDEGCLGIPALILLGSIIDTMGSYFRGTPTTITIDGMPRQIETASDHFFILNHDKIFALNLSQKCIMDFYVKYRSPLTHNNTLPVNVVIDIGENNDEIFQMNDLNELSIVKLRPLFEKIKTASENFIYYLEMGNWSEYHKLSIELKEKGNLKVPDYSRSNPTANTTTIK